MAGNEMDPKRARKIVSWILVTELFAGLGIALRGMIAE